MITHIVFYVTEPLRLREFYQRLFTGATFRELEQGRYLEIRTGTVRLGFADPTVLSPLLPPATLRARSAAAAADTQLSVACADIDATITALVDAGGTLLLAPRVMPWGLKAAFIHDPAGTLIELCAERA